MQNEHNKKQGQGNQSGGNQQQSGGQGNTSDRRDGNQSTPETEEDMDTGSGRVDRSAGGFSR